MDRSPHAADIDAALAGGRSVAGRARSGLELFPARLAVDPTLRRADSLPWGRVFLPFNPG